MTRGDIEQLVAAAVADNAAWCEAVCRSLGRSTVRTPSLWAVSDPPRWFPHRISLASDVAAADVVARLPDTTDGWVKDSYATLELDEYDFTPVVHASWIHRPPGPLVPTDDWSVAESPAGISDWAAASGTSGVVTPSLVTQAGVRLVSVRDEERVVAGAALSCSTGVVGISNVFTAGSARQHTWHVVTAVAAHLFPGRDLVGYEDGVDLELARRAGFSTVGDLRIWHRPVRSSTSTPPHRPV